MDNLRNGILVNIPKSCEIKQLMNDHILANSK